MKKGHLGIKIAKSLDKATNARIRQVGLDNAREQKPLWKYGSSIAELPEEFSSRNHSALVVAAGPSLHRFETAKKIKQSRYKGIIIAVESSLSWCLRNGIRPDLVVTVDPFPHRVVRWFGSKDLTLKKLREDDYFSRQDMDPFFQHNQMKLNRETIKLINKHGRHIKMAVSTSTSKVVVERILDAGMKIYWWNPLYDDPDSKKSVSRQLFRTNKFPLINAGGNVGTAAWVIAHAVLGKSEVGLAGMDLSYYGDTPYFRTQYFYEIKELVGEKNLDKVFVDFWNPYVKKRFYTDPAYLWYRNAFLEMVKKADCKTVNCTGGGILYGAPIQWQSLDKFLNG